MSGNQANVNNDFLPFISVSISFSFHFDYREASKNNDDN